MTFTAYLAIGCGLLAAYIARIAVRMVGAVVEFADAGGDYGDVPYLPAEFQSIHNGGN